MLQCIETVSGRSYYLSKIEEATLQFKQAVASPSESNIGSRIRRAALATQLMNEYGTAMRRLVLSDKQALIDVPTELGKEMRATVQRHYKPWVPGKTLEELSLQSLELRRVCAEANSMYQTLAVGAVDGILREQVVQEVRGAVTPALLIEACKCFVRECVAATRGKPDAPCSDRDQVAITNAFQLLSQIANPVGRAAFLSDNVFTPYAESIVSFYKDHPLCKSTVDILIAEVNKVLLCETKLCDSSFHNQNWTASLKRILQQLLLKSEVSVIVADAKQGVGAALVYPNLDTQRFQMLTNVLDFDGAALKEIMNCFAASVSSAVSTVDERAFIAGLSQLRRVYRQCVSQAVSPHLRIEFFLSMQRVLIASVGADKAVSFEEQLALYFDYCAKLPRSSENNDAIDDAAELLDLVKEEHLFIDHYKMLLAQRLLVRLKPDYALEANIVGKIRLRRSDAAARHLSIMLAEAPRRICSDAVWPPCSMSDMKVVPSLAPSVDNFLVKQQQQKRSVFFLPDYALSTAEAQINIPGSSFPVIVHGTLAQVNVLLVFADMKVQSLVDVCEKTNLLRPDAYPILQSLTAAQLVVSEGKDFVLNARIMDGMTEKKKIKLAHVKLRQNKR